ncbi:VCBS domain-containing protein, partial [Endozoicomonas sp. ALE010]|uniref:VCBS domain-containing protein n=1 Tax=Endozoicomonas sp. ALE010 TaxID=3403081 RepID=UPI003BB729F3
GSTADDASDNNTPLTLSGSAAWGSGRSGSGSAFEMDGTAGTGEISGMQTGGAMTIASWVRFDSFDQGWSRVVDFGNGAGDHNIFLSHTGQTNGLAFGIWDDSGTEHKLTLDDFLTTDQWVHITATVDSSGLMSVYKNGELAGTHQGVVPSVMVRTNNYVGKSNWDSNGYLDGAIDDLAIFNEALDASQISTLYQANQLSDFIGSVDNPAVIAGDDSATVTEDNSDVLSASGTLTISDSDAGEAQFIATTITGSYGDLILDASGQWTYSADNSQSAIQQLGEGETLTETLDVQSQDGTTHTLTITLNGSNDGPVLDVALADQNADQDNPFSYQLPADSFSDLEGDALSYSATLADGSALPAWLNFDAASTTFSGTPGSGDTGSLSVTVTASDGLASASDTFTLAVAADPATPPADNHDAPPPVAAFEFDEGAGSTADDASDNNTPLTLSGSAAWGSGRSGSG